MEKDKIEIASYSMQKELENNPLKILDLIRNEKENDKIIQHKNKDNKNSMEKNISFFVEKKEKKVNLLSKNMNHSLDKINNDIYKNNLDYINKGNIIQKNIIMDNNLSNNNVIINNSNNYYLKKDENSKVNNEKQISNNSNKFYLGNFAIIYNSNNFTNNDVNILKKNFKYILLNNINILIIYLSTNKGSIFIQQLLDEINNKELDIIFNSIIPIISQIMCLEYGNYFIQKLIKRLNIEQRLKIYKIIEPNFIEIATNKSGTHSIQSLIDCINSPIELLFLDNLLNKNMLLLFFDNNAYHIIMKIILDISEDKRNNLNLFIVLNIEKIIINYNGAFCVNKFINKNKDLKLRALLVQNLQKNINNLITNNYSCKILFLILKKFGIKYGLFIIKYIQNNFLILLFHPISMILVIKTLNYLYVYNSFELGILIWSVYKNNIILYYLLSNKSGKKLLNYMINLSDEEQRKYIFIKIKNNIKDD